MMNNVVVIEVDNKSLSDAKRKISGLTSEVKKLRNEIQKTDIVPQIILNEDKFNKSFVRTEKLLKQLTTSNFEVTVSVNDRVMHRLHSTIKELTGKRQVVHFDIDAYGAFAELNHLKRQLQSLMSKKWNITMSSPGSNKKNIPWGYAVGTPNTIQSSGQNQESSSDVIGPIADLLTFYTAADLILDKVTGKSKKNTEKVPLTNKLLTKVGSAITKSGKISLATGSTGLKLLSAGTVAGGVLAGAGIIDGGYHLLEGINANNAFDKNYESVKGGTIFGGMASGMAAGSLFGPAGIAIGGSIGYLAGKVASEPIADLFTGGKLGAQKDAAVSPAAAKRLEELRAKQAELAKSKLDEKFGKMTLSAEQLAKATENLFNPAQTSRLYAAEIAMSQLTETTDALWQSNYNLKKDTWMASTEKHLSPQQNMALNASASSLAENSKNYLMEQQYAAKESVMVLMGNSTEGESVMALMDKNFEKRRAKAKAAEQRLKQVTKDASADGTISKSEKLAIDKAQNKVNTAVSGDQDTLQTDLTKIDLAMGKDISWDSYKQLMLSATESADQRVKALEEAYANASPYLKDEDKEMLLLGKSKKGDKAGLYKQESDLYADLAGHSMDSFYQRFEKELGYFTNPIDDIVKNGMNDDVRGQITSLYYDDETRAAIGEFVDSQASVVEGLMETASLYESKGLEVPNKIQGILKQLDFLGYVSENKESDWMRENSGEKADRKFKLDNYQYLALPQAVPETGEGLRPQSNVMQGNQMLPKAVQFSVDGKSVIEGQSSITAADFGIPPFISTIVDVYIKENRIIGDSPKGGFPQPKKLKGFGGVSATCINEFRGGIVGGAFPGFAEGGYVQGGAQLITVAEEGTPEAIIPLGKHRRKRAMELFNQVGGYLQAPGFSPKGFAAGGIIGGTIGNGLSTGASSSLIDTCNVEINIEAKDGQTLIETIRDHREQISEEVAGVFNAAFKGQFANTPATGTI